MITFDTIDCCKDSRYSRELRALYKFRDFCRTFYLGQNVDGENVYGGKNDEIRFKNVDDMVTTLDSVINILYEYEEKQDKEKLKPTGEQEAKKTESRALDILERMQIECPVYYKSITSIEVTPSSEKLTFWHLDLDKDPEPELLANKKTNPDIVDGFITLNRIINNFDSYENVRLERGFDTLDGVYLKYDNKDNGCSFAFQFGDFIKELQGMEENNEQKTSR